MTEITSKPLSYWLENLSEMSRDMWLWVSVEANLVNSDTECYAVDDNVALSTEGFEQRDLELQKNGLIDFLNKDLLEDIESNLKMQKSHYSQKELYEAINYYWINDAFIDIENT